MNTLKLILWSAACATTLAGCDVFMGGQARERPVVVEEQRPVVVQQQPVIVEPRREVIVEPAPATIVDVHVR